MRDAEESSVGGYDYAQSDPDNLLIAKVVIEIPAGGIKTTDPLVLATDGTDTKLNESKLVQHTITLSEAVDTSNLPKVVSIHGCVREAKRSLRLSKKSVLHRKPSTFVLCSPRDTLQTLLTPRTWLRLRTGLPATWSSGRHSHGSEV